VPELAFLLALQARKNRSEECDLATRVDPDLRGTLARAPRRALRADREARVGPEYSKWRPLPRWEVPAACRRIRYRRTTGKPLHDNASDSADIAQERTAYRRHPLRPPRSTDRALERRPGGAEICEHDSQARESLPARARRASPIDPTGGDRSSCRPAGSRARTCERSRAKCRQDAAHRDRAARRTQHLDQRHKCLPLGRKWTSWSSRPDSAGLKPLKDRLQNQLARFAGLLGAGCNRQVPGPVGDLPCSSKPSWDTRRVL
jgi:hypothetical protein